ncbi:hypothetical protein F4825DRAFT_130735 [Nemania diffusa]|nr:hypothetical protein F4825DRAFT_130735 [Nemania diffusa]
MAGKRNNVPDAWDDDDWEVKADRVTAADTELDEPPQVSMTKAQRLAQHAESNRKLWQSAETPPEPFHFLAARPEPPLATEFKPAVKVLSRKPAPKMITKRDPLTGEVSQLKLDDGDSDDEKSKVQLSPEQIRAKQQREREEKQRRYEEVRAKIFGTAPASSGSGNGSNPSSGTSTPGNATPPRPADGRGPRGRGRGRGGGTSGGHRPNDSRGDTSGAQRPVSQSGPNSRELYDPGYSPKPSFQLERRGGGATPLSGRSTPRDEDQVIRSPRGPDGNSRGFTKRGAKAS